MNLQKLRKLLQQNGQEEQIKDLLKPVLTKQSWVGLKDAEGNELKLFEHFCSDQLACTASYLQRLFAHDVEMASLITQALKINHQGSKYVAINRPAGTSKGAALRRLKKDRMDLSVFLKEYSHFKLAKWVVNFS